MRHKVKTYIVDYGPYHVKVNDTSIKKVAMRGYGFDLLTGFITRDKSEKTSYKHSNKSYRGYEKPVRVNTPSQPKSFLNKLIVKIKRWLRCA